MDFLAPTKVISVAEWKTMALTAIKGITKRGHLPIVVGGTGLYVKALVDNYSFPMVEPKPQLRAAFEQKPLPELVALLLKLDPAAAEAVDLKNPRRVIRALEVATFTGRPFTEQRTIGKPVVDAFQVGIVFSRQELFRRIDAEIEGMIEHGWIDEIREIVRKGIPQDAPAMTSIGYRQLLLYIKGEKTLDKAIEDCKKAVHDYAKRQETWYKRDPRIHWAHSAKDAIKMTREWLVDGKEEEKPVRLPAPV
jgi:tRNA dimethylallyltransferase